MHSKVYASKFISTYQILWHLDRSCCRDKVNGAAANAHAPMVFATQLRNLYHDKTHISHLDGKAKTIYAATQAATNYTAGRYS